ncbi:MAG: HEAT repeat domain-containing protein, partial [Planctomycetales bacterium]
TNDFRANRVCRFAIVEDGAGFAAKQQPDLIRSTHVAFRPIDVKMGPDGAIYIADWYNPIIQHGEVDFRDERRDKVHGRIWRVTAKGRPLAPRPKLVGASVPSLLEQLKSSEPWTRRFAKRVLQERNAADVLPSLRKWVANLDPNDPRREHHQLEALWVFQSHGEFDPLLPQLLRARDHRARAAAVRALLDFKDRADDPLGLLRDAVTDDHPRVRLEAVRALAQFPSSEAMAAALQALDRPVDKFLDYALWLTANDLAPVWLPEIQQGELTFGGDARRLEFALSSLGSSQALRPLVELIRSGKIPDDRLHRVFGLVAGIGGPNELKQVLDHALAGEKSKTSSRAALLDSLRESARNRGVRPAGNLNALAVLIAHQDAGLQAAAVRLAGAWKLESAREPIEILARSSDAAVSLRQTAVNALANFGADATRDVFAELVSNKHPSPIRVAAVAASLRVDPREGVARTVALLEALDPVAEDPSPLYQAVMGIRNGPGMLAAALKGKKLPLDVAKVGWRIARSAPAENPKLLEALRQSGGWKQEPKAWAEADVRSMVELAAQRGDPARGESIYRRKQMGCGQCHALGGSGGQVGPDLSSVGASAPADYLVESLVLPNKKIKENYHSIVLATDDGRVLTGIKTRQTKELLTLRDARDQEISIPVKSIEQQAAGKSLMPVGAVDSLTNSELADLTRFLSQLGKPGDYSIDRKQVVRRWRVLQKTPDASRALNRMGYGIAASDDPRLTWAPIYSRVSGFLPVKELPLLVARRDADPSAFVRCELVVTTGGRVKLSLNSTEGLTIWLNDKPVDVNPLLELELPSGEHSLTIAVNSKTRGEDLRIELIDESNSAVRARLVGGK